MTMNGNKTVTANFALNNNVTVPAATGLGNITLLTNSPGCGFYSVQARTRGETGNRPVL